jgi:shikimate kinase
MTGRGATHPGHVVLIGMMGTGKTTVGRLVATLLSRPFIDSDEQVEARTGESVEVLFESKGESAFRAEESAVLAEALAAPVPSVIAAAGGAILDATNRELIRQASVDGGLVVWLLAEPDMLVARVAEGTHRPLLADDPADALARLSAIREPLYADVADVALDAADAPLEIGARIVAQVTGQRIPVGDGPAARPGSGSGS